MGLNSSNDFSIKVSADGSAWKSLLETDAGSANICIPQRLLVGDGDHRGSGLTIAKTNPSIYLQDIGATGNAHSGIMSWVDGDGMERAWCGLSSNYNSRFSFLSKCADGMRFITYGGAYPIEFAQHNTVRMLVHENGNVGIHEAVPTAPLHVNGAVRVGNVTVATLPLASNSSAGAIIFMSDETGGATLAFSDGKNWLRVQDRAVVS